MAQAELLRRSTGFAPEDCYRFSGLGMGLPIVSGQANKDKTPFAGVGSMWADEVGNPYVTGPVSSRRMINTQGGLFFWTPTLVDDGGGVTFVIRPAGSLFFNVGVCQAFSDNGVAFARLFGRYQVISRSGPGGGGLLLQDNSGGLPFAPVSGGLLGAIYSSVGTMALTTADVAVKTQCLTRVSTAVDGVQLLRFENGTVYDDLAAYVDAGDFIDISISYPIIWNP